MSPERWRQITAFFHAARACDAAARGPLLEKACAGDAALRREVDALLAADGEAGRFGDTPVFSFAPAPPRLEPGSALGPYRIDERIGMGGMGEVYRARDPRLGRAIAIKVLYAAASGDADARAPLMREARSAAALNHAHVCTIYDVGEANGQAYIAMELIEGQPLDQLIPPGGLTFGDVLRYGLQIADAMAHAHRRGVLHGDLKPANVMVSDLGGAKILDFGLARILTAAEPPEPRPGQPGTGLVQGTAAYMAPEQARGRATDERSDIFSCGVMLYEMATGSSPFGGATPVAVLDAVLHADPEPIATLRSDLPSGLSAVVRKALAKDPSRRYQAMSDLTADLRRLQRSASGSKKASLATGAAAVILFVALAAWFVLRAREEVKVPAAARITQVTTRPGLEYSPTWSPDGRSLAYVSDTAGNLDIYVQEMAGGEPVRVTDSPADDVQPAWSPDGSRIAFVSARGHQEQRLSVLIGMSRLQSILALRNGDVWVMPARGGTGRRIAEDAYDPAWSPDGKQIVYAGAREGEWGLWIRDVDTPREPRRLAVGAVRPSSPARFESAVVIQPAWSPDGKWIAFTAGREDPFLRVFVVPTEGGQASALTPGDTNTQMPSWSPDGRWLYFSSESGGRINLYKARFHDGTLGPVHQVTTGSGAELQPRFDPQGRRIAYSSLRDVSDLWEHDLESGHATRITSETTDEDNARPSPDGTWLAFASNRLNGKHLWLLNRATGRVALVSTLLNPYPLSRWSGDGRSLLYSDFPDGHPHAIWQYELSTGQSRKLYQMHEGDEGFCVTADDKYLVLSHQSGALVRVELASGRRDELGRLPAGAPGDLACAPDGRLVAFQAQRGDDRDIWLIPLAGGHPRQLTFGASEDSHPTWSADGRVLYFLRNHQDIYSVPPAGGEAKPVTRYRSFGVTLDYPAVSGDGKKILFTRIDKAGDIYVLEHSPD